MLENLSLVDVPASAETAQQLAAALPAAKKMHRLTLGLQNVTPGGHAAIAAALPLLKALRRLDLLGVVSSADAFEKYAAAIPRCEQLERLRLAHSVVGDASWTETLAAAAPLCPALKQLDLDALSLQSEEPVRLAPVWHALPECKVLETVTVTDTWLSTGDVCLLCPVAEHCVSLRVLAFARCGLEQECASILRWAVSKLAIRVEVE